MEMIRPVVIAYLIKVQVFPVAPSPCYITQYQEEFFFACPLPHPSRPKLVFQHTTATIFILFAGQLFPLRKISLSISASECI